MIFGNNRRGRCENCGKPVSWDQPRCTACGTVNRAGDWVEPDRSRQCGNCHAGLEPGDKYCRLCGTKAGEGAFEPYQNLMQCIYGPMPVPRTHTCTKCGFSWQTTLMIDRQKYCPQCGSPATVSDDRLGGMYMGSEENTDGN